MLPILIRITSFLSWLVSLYCVSWLFPKETSRFKRLWLTLSLDFSLNALIAMGFALVHWRLNLYALAFLICLTCFMFKSFAGYTPLKKVSSRWFDRPDLAAVVLASLFTIFISLAVINYGDLPNLPLLTRGEDSGSHFSIINAINQEHSYLYRLYPLFTNRLIGGTQWYPQGFHLNVNVLYWYIFGINSHNLLNLINVFSLMVIYFFLSSLCFYVFILGNFLTGQRRWGLYDQLLTILSGLFIFGYFYMYLLIGASLAQMAAVSNLLLLVYLMTNPKPIKHQFFILVLTNLVIGYYWYYLLPISSLMLIYALRRDLLRSLRLKFIYLGSILFSLIPAYYVTKYISPAILINAWGGSFLSTPLNPILLGGLSLLAFIYLILDWGKIRYQENVRLIFLWQVISGLFMLTIMTFQWLTAKTLSYYFVKSETLYLIPLVLIGVILMLNLVNQLCVSHRNRFFRFLVMVIPVCLGLGLNLRYSIYLTDLINGRFNLLHPRIIHSIIDVSNRSDIAQKDVFTIADCPLLNHATIRWISAILLRWPDSYGELTNLSVTKQANMDQIKSYIYTYPSLRGKLIIDATTGLNVSRNPELPRDQNMEIYPSINRYNFNAAYFSQYCSPEVDLF